MALALHMAEAGLREMVGQGRVSVGCQPVEHAVVVGGAVLLRIPDEAGHEFPAASGRARAPSRHPFTDDRVAVYCVYSLTQL